MATRVRASSVAHMTVQYGLLGEDARCIIHVLQFRNPTYSFVGRFFLFHRSQSVLSGSEHSSLCDCPHTQLLVAPRSRGVELVLNRRSFFARYGHILIICTASSQKKHNLVVCLK